MAFLAVVGGALRYELWMQVRRRVVWLVLALIAALALAIWALIASDTLTGYYSREQHIWVPPAPSDAILGWAQLLTMLLPVGVGLVLADRLARDHTTAVDELLDTVPGSLGARLLGKYLGATLATLVPVVLLYSAVIVYIESQAHDAGALALAAAAFAAVLLPGTLFAAGLSLAIPAFVKVPVYQLVFIGYWFWANLMSPKIGLPSPVATMLNATGPWAQEGLFGFPWAFLRLHATPAQALASIALLVGLGLAAPGLAWAYLRWRAARR